MNFVGLVSQKLTTLADIDPNISENQRSRVHVILAGVLHEFNGNEFEFSSATNDGFRKLPYVSQNTNFLRKEMHEINGPNK